MCNAVKHCALIFVKIPYYRHLPVTYCGHMLVYAYIFISVSDCLRQNKSALKDTHRDTQLLDPKLNSITKQIYRKQSLAVQFSHFVLNTLKPYIRVQVRLFTNYYFVNVANNCAFYSTTECTVWVVECH